MAILSELHASPSPLTLYAANATTDVSKMKTTIDITADNGVSAILLLFSYLPGLLQITYVTLCRCHPQWHGLSHKKIQHVPVTAPTARITPASMAWYTYQLLLLACGPTMPQIISFYTVSPVSPTVLTTKTDHNTAITNWYIPQFYCTPTSASLCLYAISGAARYSAPSSILDGALATIGQPSCNKWMNICYLFLDTNSSPFHPTFKLMFIMYAINYVVLYPVVFLSL